MESQGICAYGHVMPCEPNAKFVFPAISERIRTVRLQLTRQTSFFYLDKKKKTNPEIRGEKNAVPPCDIMLDDVRSAQGKSRGQSRMTLPCVDCASSSMISQDRTAFFSPRISGMVLFCVQGSSIPAHHLTFLEKGLPTGELGRLDW